jgi:hypothetical protein
MASGANAGQGLISVRVQGLQELATKDQKDVRRSLYAALKQVMLPGDILGMLQEGHYGVLVAREPGWPAKLRDSVLTSLKSSLNGAQVKVKVAAADFQGAKGDVEEVLHNLHDSAVEV